MSFTSLLTTIATLFLLMVVGFICGKLRIIDETSSKNLSTLIVKVGQPFLVISSLIILDYSAENLKTCGIIFALGLLVHFLLAFFSFLFAIPLRKKQDPGKLAEFAMVFTNCGFIGFPILKSIFGDIGLFYGAFYVVSIFLFTWTWGIAILARGRSDIRLTVKKALVNYGTIPCLIGLLLFILPLPLPEACVDLCAYVGNLCTPISVLITGANLSRRSLLKLLKNPYVYYVNLIRLIVLPLLTTVILWLLGLPDYLVIFSCVMTAMPSAANITMFGELYNIEPGTAAEFVGSTSILCTATLLPVISFANWLVQF